MDTQPSLPLAELTYQGLVDAIVVTLWDTHDAEAYVTASMILTGADIDTSTSSVMRLLDDPRVRVAFVEFLTEVVGRAHRLEER